MGKYSALNITGALAAVLWAQGGAAQAADPIIYSPEPVSSGGYDFTAPAVSAPNGKIELYGGMVNPGGPGFRAAGSLSLPVTDQFGVQFDAGVVGSSAGPIFGGAVHAFTRDPDNYLLGLTGAVARGPTGTIGVIGVEGELYLDRLSLEAWAGVGGIDYDVLPDVTGIFIFADAGYYVTDDFRLTAGFSHLIGKNSLHLGSEYLMRDFTQMPISLTTDLRVSHSGAYSVMAGIKGYFGGDDPGKSLIDRHRQDDPPNRALSIVSAATHLLTKEEDEPEDPEAACLEMGPYYYWDGDECIDTEVL